MSFFQELKRRNVFRAGGAYVVVAWIAIQVIETISPVFGFGDSVIRISVIILAIGLLPAIVLAWAFELTPDGLKHESEVNYSSPVFLKFGKRVDRLVMVLLALGLAYFAFDKFILSPEREETLEQQKTAEIAAAHERGRTEALVESYGDKSIAVLPFINMSDDASNEFFSDGLSEELLNLLAKIPELRVIARTSSFAYKGKDTSIADVARELNVKHVLEGSVRKAGNQVRITAQLIRANDSSHLWSETYDRSLDNIFTIQDEIAAAVVAELKMTLLGAVPTVEKTDPEAYALYLQARYLKLQRTPESWDEAIALYQQTLEIAPDYAAAWVGLGGTYQNQAGRGMRPFDEGLQLAQAAVEKALAIDPDYAPAHAMLGWLAMYFKNDLAEAAGHLGRALALEPGNLDSLSRAATLLQNLGRPEQGISVQQYILARDPINDRVLGNLGLAYNSLDRPDEVLPLLRTSLRLNPGKIGTHSILGFALLLKNEPEAALAAIKQEPLEAFRLIGLVMAYHALGQKDESDAALAELLDKHEQGWSYNIAFSLAYRGEADRAFEWLAKAIEYKDPGLTEIPTQLEFANIHDDPRWLPFLESIGKSPEQLAAIEFTVTIPK